MRRAGAFVSRHRRWFAAALVTITVVAILTPPLLGVRFTDDRHDRRVAAAAAQRVNVARDRQNRAAIAAVARLTLQLCTVQNTDARRLNTLIDYFEGVAKQVQPGPETDAFWARVPRPTVKRCPREALPLAPQSPKGPTP